MARGRSARRSGEYAEFWPGYVDVMSTLLMVFVFLLSIFMLAQYFVSQESSGKDVALRRLNRQIAELTNLLSLEKGRGKTSQDELATLRATLADLRLENERLSSSVSSGEAKASAASARVTALTSDLDKQKLISNEALARVDLLNQQLLALRRQIAALNTALEASEKRDQASQDRIKDLGTRLNAALARQVQELKRYRSEFFGRLAQLLKHRKDIRVVGDRFVFQSEVLFATGSADINDQGKVELNKVASAIKELMKEIPTDIDWVLQINGHTDKQPISGGGRFKSNWELSAARAISVVEYFISQGIPPDRLVAAGYGQYQPLVQGDTPDAYAQNRRIELKLTSR